MKKTSIVTVVAAGMITLLTGTYALAAKITPTSDAVVKTNDSDIMVMPGTTDNLRLHFSGADRLHREFPGGLTVYQANGETMHYRPDAYQMINGKLKAVDLSFHIEGRDQVTVKFGKIDKSAPVFLKRGGVMFSQGVGI
jgi:hypothetical protein